MQEVGNGSAGVRIGREASSRGRARTATGGRAAVRPLVAEFIATFALVFVGVGAIVVSSPIGLAGLVGVALAHGLVLATMVTATAAISGGHVNPAVTFGALL